MSKLIRLSDMRILGDVEPGFVPLAQGLGVLSDEDAAGLEWAFAPSGESPPPVPDPVEVRLTPREFMSRLTLTRQEDITAAAVTAAVAGNARPLNWLFRMLGAEYVDPADPETAGGVAALEAAGLITAAEAAALLA